MQRIIVTTTDDAQSFSVQRGLVSLCLSLRVSDLKPNQNQASEYRMIEPK